ncbi:hypothetical protein HPP92_024216 [Vanilla planifolia]|uniref:PH domain-containing protein n=1 Tax=Vanilla planifolia TaxID=51239 RepID=A0A835UCR1_VANPL|nr:hypothetical protein HPP92_024216 [Vanilla planifolia]
MLHCAGVGGARGSRERSGCFGEGKREAGAGFGKPCEELVEQAACSGASVGGCGECGGRTEPGGRGRGGTGGEGERGKSSGGGNVKVAGILYKWVNYGKGWRSRWFVLQDGVLSYYKVHGPDKISVGPAWDAGGIRVIGEDSHRRMRRERQGGDGAGQGDVKQWKPFGEIHLKVSSVRSSKSDDKRLSIFTGTKTLHLRCDSREDRCAWIEALLTAKDLFPRFPTSYDLATSVDVIISTEKLRARLLQEGLDEKVIKDCESIVLSETSELRNQLKFLQQKHIVLLDALRLLETEKLELETTVVDETKGREANLGANGRFSDFYSVMSDGSATDSDVDIESQGADGETDDDDGAYFDTKDFLSSEFLRSGSYRSHGKGIKAIEYPFVKREGQVAKKEKEKPTGLWSIIKENIGKDLSGVCLPVYFNEPLSSLQKCFEDLEYSYLVDRAQEWESSIVVLVSDSVLGPVEKWQLKSHYESFAVSGYASTEGRQCKPFNPLLGETYEADYPDKGRGWKFWGESNLKGKFWGRSIQLDPIGILTLQLEDGETFQWSKVTTSIYNIILGKICWDLYGTMRIRGIGQYSCKLKFKEQSIIDRNPHQVHGFVQDNKTGDKVAMLLGKWDEAIYYVLGDPSTKPKGYDPMSEAVLLWEHDKSISQTRYNLRSFAISLNELTPGLLEKLPLLILDLGLIKGT